MMISEVSDDYPRAVAEPQQVKDWERLMSLFQRPLPETLPGEKWAELSRIFSLDELSEGR
jgi:L-rhamnose mutarotase